MTTAPGESVAESVPLFPVPRTCPFDVPAHYVDARETGGLHPVTIWDGSRHWLATRYDDVRQVLSDPRFSADVRHPNFPLVTPDMRENQAGIFLRMDDPAHARLRRMLNKEFHPAAIKALRGDLLAITDELIDAMLADGPRVDLVEQFALPMPTKAICLILGVPYDRSDLLQRHAEALTDLKVSTEERITLHRAALAYFAELVEQRRRKPAGDLISRLLADHIGPDAWAVEDLPKVIAILVGAGHETTANMLGLSVLALLERPDELAKLRANPKLAASAAEEMLRFWSVVSTDPRRVALENVKVGGHLVREGEGIIVSLLAANHDRRRFGSAGPALDDLAVDRAPGKHIAFGFGTHQCLGQALARAELQVALPHLFERIPDLRLAVPVEDLTFKLDTVVYGLDRLPVVWGEPDSTPPESFRHDVGGFVNGRGRRLAGRVAIVSGAGTVDGGFLGTGAATALLFAAQGAQVGVLDMSADRAARTCDLIRAGGGTATELVTDLCDEGAVGAAVDGFARAHRRLDVVVNNAGIMPVGDPLTASVEDWNRVFAVNVTGMMIMCRVAHPHLARTGGGSIVNVSSVAAVRGFGSGAYGASKGAVQSMTTDFAYSLGADGIRVNCLVPGHLHTPMGSVHGGEAGRDLRRRANLLGTEGSAWDLAWAALFLAGAESRWITGISLPVDAGSIAATGLGMLARLTELPDV